jgi:hypothetical protein
MFATDPGFAVAMAGSVLESSGGDHISRSPGASVHN